MTTLTDLANQIDRDLMVHYTRPIYDIPASSYNTSQTTITLSSVDALGVGAVLDAAFELMYVTAWNESTKQATVIRGFLGTTAASGTSATIIRVNPRVPTVAMLDTMLDEIRSWDERVFTTEADSVEFTASATSVEATPTADNIYRVLFARPQPSSSADERTYVYLGLRRNEAVGQFASGFSLHLDMPFGAGTTVDVLYAVPFDLSSIASDTNLEGLGLTAGMLEILKWGALARITAGKELPRLDYTTFGRPDVTQAVPPTAHLQASAQYQQMRNMAYEREARRLLALWPIRFHG